MKIFDGHSDLWEDVDEKRRRGLRRIISSIHNKKWAAGSVEGGFYPIWVDPESKIDVRTQAHSIIKNMCADLRECAEVVCVVRNISEYNEAIKKRKHAIFLGSEGLSYLDDIEELEFLYYLGFREASLTWNEENSLACGAGCATDNGLTNKGKDCVKKMLKLNMVIDLAHAGDKTFWDIMSIVDVPCMISHGNSKALCSVDRNCSDQQLRAIAERNGVVGVSAYPYFISEQIEKHTVEGMAEHIAYIAELIGTEYVGLGFDFVDFLDDAETDPMIAAKLAGFECIDQSLSLISALHKKGFYDNEIAAICEGNFLRLVENVLS